MPKVFVHGNPETSAIWSDLVAELAQRGVTDVIRLSPPGFGAPLPDGWGGTQDEYARWLERELLAINESSPGNIDLVGHDWGAGHVFGVLARQPSLVHTWAADCVGLLHPNYVWHDAAQQWQTLDVGEQAVESLVALDVDTFAAVFGSLGMSDRIAREVKEHVTSDMARSILSLYRSAAQPAMADLGRAFVSTRPAHGLVVLAENDHYAGPHDNHREMASLVGAAVAEMPGCGHWWMIENPARAADILVAHWGRAQDN